MVFTYYVTRSQFMKPRDNWEKVEGRKLDILFFKSLMLEQGF